MITWPFIQDTDELTQLLNRLDKDPPETVLEIGTFLGGTLNVFCEHASGTATIISVDLPGGPFGGGYKEIMIPLYQSLARGEQKLHLIREDSHKIETLQKVENLLGDRELDFLFIDGDHSYEGVKQDFLDYAPLVKKGGLIGLHDITKRSDPEVKVYEFWEELKQILQDAKIEEIVRDPGQMGIGLITK